MRPPPLIRIACLRRTDRNRLLVLLRRLVVYGSRYMQGLAGDHTAVVVYKASLNRHVVTAADEAAVRRLYDLFRRL